MPEPKLISIQQLMRMLNIVSYTTVYRYVEDGLIPEPILIGNKVKYRRRFWLEHEVIQFLEKAAEEQTKLDAAIAARRADAAEKKAKFLAAIGCI